ncbi:dynamin family protein [Luteolibacter sp. GHJ8]|uniref:Dynamin family protein n=1 Tax=Luteolibacter rhizosphaerae TaxID=2989719 RepID=A0ABT3FWU7_9BACT|nr:dynamin family protein [Luteolibacter rhizosphaerae]MCW1912033.1 dynamin family protein [Luteolibacter rhizosphaerae]
MSIPGERYFAVRDRLSELLEWIGHLAREVALEEEPDHPAPVLHRPILIAAIGEVNAGKSSLLNALVGEELCPASPLPLTTEVRLYRHGAEADKEVQPQLVEVRRPAEYLRNFDLLDTPGTNSKVNGHAETAEPFLEHADLILIVFTAENPWTASTWDAVSRLSNEALSRTALVVQRIDLKQAQDIPIILGHMRDLSLKRIGQVLPIFPVAARSALESKQTNHAERELWRTSRFSDLEHFISERICESMERRQVLHDAWHHAARTLRRLENRFDGQRRGMEDDAYFLGNIEREMDALRDSSLEAAPEALGEALKRYRSEVDAVVRHLRSKLGWWRSLGRIFTGDGTAAEVEARFAARMQEVATGFAQHDAARLVDACAAHWETVRPRVKERMGFEPGACDVDGKNREGVVSRFVARLEKAVPQALAGLRVRGVLDPLVRRRNASLKGFTGIGLALCIAAGSVGTLYSQQLGIGLLGAALAVFCLAALVSWITAARIAAGYRERLLAGASTFADGLKADHGEAIRFLCRDYSGSLLEVRRRLASEKAALQPRLERSNSLYIALKSVELDL